MYSARVAAGGVLYLQLPAFDRLRSHHDAAVYTRHRYTADELRAMLAGAGLRVRRLTYANALRASCLSPKLRELAILTVGHCTDSRYEIAHHRSHAEKAGVTARQLKAIARFDDSPVFDEKEKAVMAFARESTQKVDLSEATWQHAARFLNQPELIALSLVVAWYNSGVRIMGALAIELEPGYTA